MLCERKCSDIHRRILLYIVCTSIWDDCLTPTWLTNPNPKRSVYDHEFVIASPPIAYDHSSHTLVFLWLWRWSGGWSLGRGLAPPQIIVINFFVPTQHPIMQLLSRIAALPQSLLQTCFSVSCVLCVLLAV